MNPFLRKLTIYTAPIALGLLELYHPVFSRNETIFENILPKADLWLEVHILQVPLFGLIALSVILLIDKLEGWIANLSRISIGIFASFYIALDSVTGIASGLLIQKAREFPENLQDIVAQQVNLFFLDPVVGGGTFFSIFSILAAGGWFVGVIAAAISLKQVGVDRLSVFFLVLAAILFALSHVPPPGPLAMLFFFLAVIRMDFSWEKQGSAIAVTGDASSRRKLENLRK